MKELGEIMNILRENLGAVNVDLVDSEGNAREYDDIIAELEQTEEGLTQAEQLKNAAIIFGKQNLSGMLAIINATDKDYDSLTNSIYNCEDTAQNMAETMQDNLQGQLTILKSQLEELSISFGEILMPTIREIVAKIQAFADKLNSLSPATKQTILKIALVVAAIAPLLIAIGSTISVVGQLMTTIANYRQFWQVQSQLWRLLAVLSAE
ncbi:MAG: phage tail tape measure protein [Oscillospiraceae bacterium]